MKAHYHRAPAMTLVGVACCAAAAFAQLDRTPGQTYVYELTVTSNTQVDLSKLPAAVRGAVQANLAAGGTPTVYVLTAATGQVNADGSANVHVQFTNSRLPNSPVFARVNQFDAILSPVGQLLPTYDTNMRPSPNQMSEDQMRNTTAQTIDQQFATFNDFAGGCGKHGHLRTGDSWRVASTSRFSVAQYDLFAVTGVAGPVAVVTMKGGYSSSGGSNNFEATGHYDMARRLVLDLHVAQTFQNAAASSGTSTMDYRLRE